MAIDIGLDSMARGESAQALRALLGETYALYFKTHGYHWNVTGPRFSELHTMFMGQYTELWNALDVIAERMRALDHFAPVSSAQMMAGAAIPADTEVPGADAMLANLASGHEAVSRAAKAGLKAAEANGDAVTADLMTQRADIAEKTAWMLRASI